MSKQDTLNNLIMYNILVSELQCEILKFLPVEEIYKTIAILDKYHYELVNYNYFFKILLKYTYPKQKDIILDTDTKNNFKKIHKIMYRKFVTRLLNIPTQQGNIMDYTIVLPYNIIASLLNLPMLNYIYTDIIGYLRAYNYNFDRLINFEINEHNLYRVTLFVNTNNSELFNNIAPGEAIKMNFDKLLTQIIPINIKNINEYKNIYNNIHIITLQIYKNNINTYYSKINYEKSIAMTLFEEVKNDFITKYC
jgi:hypothetical protein